MPLFKLGAKTPQVGDNAWVARTQEQLTALRDLVLQSPTPTAPRPASASALPRR